MDKCLKTTSFTRRMLRQYVGGNSRVWRVRLYDGVELEYDLDEWAPFN
jgi:hypothetical protein